MKNVKFSKIITIAIGSIVIIITIFLVFDYILSLKKGVDWLNVGDLATVVIGAISSVSTIVLGYISFWQNKMQREDNLRSEKRMREQYQKDKEDMVIQHKIDVLVNNLNVYIDKLHQIDTKLNEKNFECDMLDFLNKFENCKTVEELKYNVLMYKRTISENVVLINYIYNCIVYNKYYVNDLYNCAIAIVELRHEMELYSIEQINEILNRQLFIIDKADKVKFDDATKILMDKYLNFKNYWTIFLQDAISTYERMIYKNCLNEFLEWFDDNSKETAALRKKVQEIN